MLGWLGSAFAALASIALVVIIGREVLALSRLPTIEKMHANANARPALLTDDRAASRAIVRDLTALAHANPQLARARAALKSHADDIIDGADMIRLAERELMTPLDREARRLVSVAAQRVSIVTAISPRALIDVLFVAAAALRLVRQLALLYGGRPGALGTHSIDAPCHFGHLALTGGLAAERQSCAADARPRRRGKTLDAAWAKASLNGLLTARLGLAAIDVTRPLPFNALPRHRHLSDLGERPDPQARCG